MSVSASSTEPADDYHKQLKAIIENTPNVAIQGYGADGRVTFWNNASRRLYGYAPEQALGKRLVDLIWTQEEEDQFQVMLREIVASGKPAPMKEWSITIADGSRRHILSTLFPVSMGEGRTSVICMDVDITERKNAEQSLRDSEARLAQLLRELDHRVKNNLASLHALVDIYAQSAPSVEDFAQTMRGKLLAMRAAHDIIAAGAGRPVALDDLLQKLLRQYEPPGRTGGSIGFLGPPLSVAPRQVSPIAMIFQELLVNADKHGAFRDPKGKITVSWTVEARSAQGVTVLIVWEEHTDLPPSAGPGKGIGLGLIESLAGFDLGGKVSFQFAPTGFRCELVCVLDPEPVENTPRGGAGA